jgi:hypothetical protein
MRKGVAGHAARSPAAAWARPTHCAGRRRGWWRPWWAACHREILSVGGDAVRGRRKKTEVKAHADLTAFLFFPLTSGVSVVRRPRPRGESRPRQPCPFSPPEGDWDLDASIDAGGWRKPCKVRACAAKRARDSDSLRLARQTNAAADGRGAVPPLKAGPFLPDARPRQARHGEGQCRRLVAQ